MDYHKWESKWSDYIATTRSFSSSAQITARNHIELGRIRENSKLLDMGCGHGRITLLIGLQIPRLDIVGIDVTPELLQNFLLKPGVNGCQLELICGDLVNIPKKSGEFDVVISTRVFQYLCNPLDGIREAHRILRPGGRIVLSIPNKLNPIKFFTYKEKLYSPFEVAGWLTACGFKSIVTKSICFFPSTTYLTALVQYCEIFNKVPIIKYFGGEVLVAGEKNK
jgi:ubiquinone/menaquinone biosynthesis C-methylase UbiE